MLKALSTVSRVFFDLCLLKTRPQDLPGSNELLLVCLAVYTSINILLLSVTTSFTVAVASALLDTTLLIVITWIILGLNKHNRRLLKTLMALAGAGCIISLMAMPLFLSGSVENIPAALQSIIFILYFVLLIWNVVIMGHILRHALDAHLGVGIVFAIMYVLISSMLVSALMPLLE